MAESETEKVNPNPEAAKARSQGGTPLSTWARRQWELRKQPRRAAWPELHPLPTSIASAAALSGPWSPPFLTAWFLAFFRFFLPRTLFEPNTVFKIGYPSEFALGVDTKFQQKFRIWVDRTPDRAVRDLRSLHASGLHARLEAQRKQIQMSLPRQWLRQ